MLPLKQQAFELLNKSKNILIVLPQNLSGDSLGSGLALLNIGQRLDKKIELIAPAPVPEKLSFLPGLEQIKTEPIVLRDFIISIDTTGGKVKQLRYQAEESILKIFLASQGKLEQKDVKLEPGQFNYDLVITIDAPDLETLGQFYENHTELFFEKPILNIDHRSANEYFGEVNLVEPTASSSAEILADFFNNFFVNQINDRVATCLLTGIIDETHSFQKSTTSPQTFNLASFLITQGAEKEKIIQFLYKTKSLNYLKLWGRLLSRLEWQAEKNLVWLEAEPDDFQMTKTSPEQLALVAEEIHDLLPQLNASIILWPEEPMTIAVLVQSPQLDFLQRLNLELGGSLKNNQAWLKIVSSNLSEAKARLINLINSLL